MESSGPMGAAQRLARQELRKRFYDAVDVAPDAYEFVIVLDGRPARTPARRVLSVPAPMLAEALAAEWRAQEVYIDPARMPLNRLVNEEASMNMLNMLSFWAAVWTIGGGLVILLAADQVRMRGTNWLWPLVIIGGTLLWYLFKRAAVGQARGYGEALKTLVDMRRLRLLQALGFLKESGELALSEEAALWKALYRLYAEADAEGLPPVNYKGEES